MTGHSRNWAGNNDLQSEQTTDHLHVFFGASPEKFDVSFSESFMKFSKFKVSVVAASMLALSGCSTAPANRSVGFDDDQGAVPVKAVSGPQFFDEASQMGCGAIVSVRNVDQWPVGNGDETRWRLAGNGKMSSGGTFGQLAGGGVIGFGAALLGSLVVDGVADATKSPPPEKPGMRYGHKVFAIKLLLDDGREINMPMIERAPTFSGGQYKAGRRERLSFNNKNAHIQFENSFQPPIKGESGYAEKCALKIDKAVADDIILRSAKLVDETKIVN